MKTLLAGPWIGEFGWELFCWQGYVRKLSKKYDKVIIIGRPTNEFLYSDFCDEYIPFDPQSFKTDMWMCHDAKNATEIIKKTPHTSYFSGNFNIGMAYKKTGVIDIKGLFFNEQNFHKYKSDVTDESFDVIFHCRNKTVGSERNWVKSQWESLGELLPNLKIACIGNHEAFHINGTKDLRGIDLSELISIMNNSKLIVGPSSGPMHLASLSGLKHLVWSTEYNKVRYERDWNPFNTDVIFYSGGDWNPNPEEIKKLIIQNI